MLAAPGNASCVRPVSWGHLLSQGHLVLSNSLVVPPVTAAMRLVVVRSWSRRRLDGWLRASIWRERPPRLWWRARMMVWRGRLRGVPHCKWVPGDQRFLSDKVSRQMRRRMAMECRLTCTTWCVSTWLPARLRPRKDCRCMHLSGPACSSHRASSSRCCRRGTGSRRPTRFWGQVYI